MLETVNGEVKECYVSSLVNVVQSYLKLKNGIRVLPQCGRRDLNPGLLAWEASVLIQARRRPHY